jgi:hypothetical protein
MVTKLSERMSSKQDKKLVSTKPESKIFDCYVEMSVEDLQKQMDKATELGEKMVVFRVMVDGIYRTAQLEILCTIVA